MYNYFFAENSLLIVAFKTRSSGGEIEEINAIRHGNKVVIEINGTKGTQTVIASQIAVLEVKKEDINGVKKVQFTTNMDKY